MKSTRSISMLAAFALAMASVFVFSDVSFGQGRYANQYSRQDVSNIIRDLEQSSNSFSADFDREMDRSPINGRPDEDRFNANVRDFENSLDRLRRNFDRNNDWWSVRSDVQNVINRAQSVNTMMNSISFRRNLERQWNSMRRNLNRLADTFDLPGLAGGGWQGGPWQPGYPGRGYPNQVSPPSWARGTFYGVAPDGSQIILTINDDGGVTANVGGSMSYGSYVRGNSLYIQGNASRVSRRGNGIRTISDLNGETIDYGRNSFGQRPGYPNYPNNPNYPNYPGNPPVGSDVPNWVVGSFTGRNPQNGGTIYLTITYDGRVTVNMDGNYSYGTVNGTVLSMGGYTSNIQQIRNGIRTVSTLDGQRIDYRRN